MIFKVLYQKNKEATPIREQTACLYVEADSIPAVHGYLANRNINIEYIQELTEAHLEHEKQSKYFTLENG